MARRRPRTDSERRARQRGFLLVGLVTMMSIFGIMSGIAVQEWSVIERRDREAELIFIQEQYAAAILSYQADQGRLPVTLEELDQTGQKNQRFIRKLYVDPLFRGSTPEDWCLLNVGPAGQVTSSCRSREDGVAGNEPSLRIGQGQPGNQQQNPALSNLGPGGKAIVGVHSKSKEASFNTVKRNESTYNRWFYTFEDYQREIASRSIPGLPQAKGPEQTGNTGDAGSKLGGRGGAGSGRQAPGTGGRRRGR